MLTNHERSSGRTEIKIYLIIKMSSSDVSSTKTPPPRRNSKNVMKNVIRKALRNNKESNVREYAEVRERILSKLKASMLGLKLDLNGINKKKNPFIKMCKDGLVDSIRDRVNGHPEMRPTHVDVCVRSGSRSQGNRITTALHAS